jgi:hypothetical protein
MLGRLTRDRNTCISHDGRWKVDILDRQTDLVSG